MPNISALSSIKYLDLLIARKVQHYNGQDPGYQWSYGFKRIVHTKKQISESYVLYVYIIDFILFIYFY